MLAKLKSYFNPGPRMYGVEIYDKDGATQYQVLEIKRAKDELLIATSKFFVQWEELLSFLDKKVPVCLVYNTKDVLHKTIENPSKLSGHSLIEKGFPNLDFERFYYNTAPFGTNAYLSLVEQHKLIQQLELFKTQQVSILDIGLGVSSLSLVLPYFDEGILETNTKTLTYQSKVSGAQLEIQNSLQTEEERIYNINGLSVSNTKLLGFSEVIGQFTASTTVTKNYSSLQKGLATTFKYDRAFHILLWPILGFFLALLLTNFFAFNHYYGKYNVLELEATTNSTNKERLVALKENVTSKEKRVQTILSNKNSKSSGLLDAIAQSVPQSVLLEQTIFQPLSKPIRATKEVVVDANEILIMGETADAESFSEWITTLEGFTWVAKVETLNYEYRRANRSGFALKITVK